MDIINYIPAKTIVTNSQSQGWFGMDYNMNIYRGCSHGCIYCDSRSECYHVDNFDTVSAKKDALEIIDRELRGKRRKGVVATGAMSDPYNPLEAKLGLTRGALELVRRHGFGMAVATKSALIERDAGLLADIGRHSPVIAKITVTTLDDELCRKLEPHVHPTSERLKALAALADKGIYCGVLLMPLLPHVNDTLENMLGIVRAAKQCGARFIYPGFGVTTRDNQRAHLYRQLDMLYPGMSRRYTAEFGNNYYCPSPRYKALQSAFIDECGKLGLDYEMPRIIHAYKQPYRSEQLTLF